MFDIAAIGESLIDFTPSGHNKMGMAVFSQNPGGAPSNVLAMASKLGGSTAFIGKVGDDDFGRFLKSSMESAGIDISGLVMAKDKNTTLAFVHLNEKGDRSFSFYRRGEADVCLRQDEVNKNLLENCGIFHFGSVSLTDEPSRGTTLASVGYAKKHGAVISYDPNYRPLLWDSREHACSEMLNALKFADIVKVSEEEMEMMTGETDYAAGSEKLAGHGAAIVIVTLGAHGSFYHTANASGIMPAYDVKTVDTNGAGDAFFGAVLYSLRNMSLSRLRTLPSEELRQIIKFGNAAGSLTTTKNGAIPAMPSISEVKKCMAEAPLLTQAH